MNRFTDRQQRTLARPVSIAGRGFLTGKTVQLCFRPAPANTGVVFHRTDLGPNATLQASVDQVTGTNRRTTLGHAPLQVSLVEHVLAAVAGLKIDNCVIEINGPEPPGLDGSAKAFVETLQEGGFELQDANRPRWGVSKPVSVSQQGATLTLYPADNDELTITYFLDYGNNSRIPRQVHTSTIEPGTFLSQLACTRTFLLAKEAYRLLRQGLGGHTTLQDLIVFGKNGPLRNTLRFANEPARHKVLDIVGDLSLLGVDLCGHVVAYRSGHPLNFELARTLSQQIHARPQPRRIAA